MTENFKEKILRWLMGKYEIETGENSPQMGEYKTLNNNLSKYIWDNYCISTKPGVIDIVRGKNSNNETIDNYILYGNYYDSDNKINGFMVVLDKLFNPIQGINTYSSGVQIGEIMCLDVDEEGKWYIIEKRYSDNAIRFMLLNNILLKSDSQSEYQVKIRKSYLAPSSPQFPDTIYKMIKQYGGSKYVFIGTLNSISRNITLTINTTSENEWGAIIFAVKIYSADGWAEWHDDGILKLFVTGEKFDSTSSLTRYYICEYDNNANVKAMEITPPHSNTIYQSRATILNSDSAYILATEWEDGEGSTYKSLIFKVNLNTNSFKMISSKSYKSGYLGNSGYFDISNDGVNAYYYITTPNDIDSGIYDYYVGLIYDDNVYEYFMGSQEGPFGYLTMLNVTSQFNLYKYYLQLGNKVTYSNLVFNNNEYNGQPYDGINGLVPNSTVPYYPNNETIFARNLYNKIVRENTTTSTLEIPNTLLNDSIINYEELRSKTNNKLNFENRMFSKNIYETVNINFINSILIKNSNNPDNEIINNIGSSRLNDSISLTNDYDNAKITKYRINYQDNTNRIVMIDCDKQITFVEPDTVTIDIAVYNPSNNPIVNIQFISDDEETVYQEIETSSFFVKNKYYSLKQTVKII